MHAMGTSLDYLPLILAPPLLASLFLLGLIFRRWLRQRAERTLAESELLRFSNILLLVTAFSESGDLKQMLERTLEGTLRALGLPRGCVLLYAPEAEEMNGLTARGFSHRALARLSESPLREYLSSCGERWGSLAVFPDLLKPDLLPTWHRDPLFERFREVFTADGLRTLLAVALQTKERSYGALIVGGPEVRTFRASELRLTEAICNQLAVTLENHFLEKVAERHDADLKLLDRVAKALSTTFDLSVQLHILQCELRGMLGGVNYSLALQDSPEGRLETVFGSNNPGIQPAADGLCQHVLRTGKALLIAHDFLNTARRLEISPIDPRIHAWAGVPIQFSDQSLGVLAVADFEREGTLNERHFQLLQVLASEAAVAIENAKLFQQEVRRARHLALLNEFARKTAAVLNPQELLSNVCQQLREAFGYDLVRIEVVEGENELVVKAQEGHGLSAVDRRLKVGEGLAGTAAASGEPVLANDVMQDSRYLPFHPGVRSALHIPVIYGTETLGVLSVESLREHSFCQQDVLTLQTLADQLAVAMDSARAFQVAQEGAITDGLTGLKTHRYFMEALDAEWRRSPRSGRFFSLIMIDLDGFKQVNDRHGHLEGDRVLNAVARILEARSRQLNVVARYGGDEFAILMPEAKTEQAKILAERLCSSLSAAPYLAGHGVTASLGIATFPTHGATPDEILRVAESGMYLAKHEQGNRVRVASSSSESTAAEWERQLLQAYLGVAVKRMFSTGPEAFNQYLTRFEQATQGSGSPNLSLMDTVTALAFAIDAKDHYTQGHSRAVSHLAAHIAQHLGLSTPEMEEIRLAGILHDIGKIGVPESVLNKPARLTPEEYAVMKNHATLGERILEPLKVEAIERIRKMVRHHHERFDGAGYPDGLSGEQIPLGARILSIADCFDTLISDRAYKKGCSREEAILELRRCSGSHFDAALVEAFLQSLATLGDPRQKGRATDVN
jgi:diguanylate cyclase (GGDEF)-like protein/putative nucleotidyltransferase with HDIG domain